MYTYLFNPFLVFHISVHFSLKPESSLHTLLLELQYKTIIQEYIRQFVILLGKGKLSLEVM